MHDFYSVWHSTSLGYDFHIYTEERISYAE